MPETPFPPLRLRELFESVEYAVSRDDGREALQHVYLENCRGDLLAVATDGHRLAVSRLVGGAMPELEGVLLSRETRKALRKLLKKTRGGPRRLVVTRGKTSATLTVDGFSAAGVMATLETDNLRFPPRRQVCPKPESLHEPISLPAEAAGAIRQVASVHPCEYVDVVASGPKLTVCTTHTGRGGARLEGEARFDRNGRGVTDWEFRVNGHYLADAIEHAGTLLFAPRDPVGIIRVGDPAMTTTDSYAVVMPVRV